MDTLQTHVLFATPRLTLTYQACVCVFTCGRYDRGKIWNSIGLHIVNN